MPPPPVPDEEEEELRMVPAAEMHAQETALVPANGAMGHTTTHEQRRGRCETRRAAAAAPSSSWHLKSTLASAGHLDAHSWRCWAHHSLSRDSTRWPESSTAPSSTAHARVFMVGGPVENSD